ncbi:hypothetical protein TNCV_528911 [Trichonephila clavipes]|nr:hypothetical protein TNCV_528911 [Trichonephila clavipes]
MFRSSGQFEAKPPVSSSQVNLILIYRPSEGCSVPPEASMVFRQIAGHILLVSLRRARCNEMFCTLPPVDQSAILQDAWGELFLLQAAYWPVDILIVAKHIEEEGKFGLAIHQNDHQARRRFVEWAQNEIAVVPDFHKRILFSDEAHFWLNGYVNKQNCRIWSEANPQVYVETPLHPEKLTVWCALWAGGILLQKR